MVTPFEFATAGRIIFGRGTVKDVGTHARAFGTRALVVTGRSAGRAAHALARLTAAGLETTIFQVAGEPDVALAQAGAELARRSAADVVIGIGGGSVVDSAKAIAALAANTGQPLDYLEVIGRGQPLERAPLPSIAVPTTAGTGSEVTRNAVLTARKERVKVSLRSPQMLPRVAIVDPELTVGLPPALTAATGLDALTQLIEPFVSARANPMTDALCVDGITRVVGALRAAVRDGTDIEAREDMALASLHGGLALANAGLGAVHGLAGPIGGMFGAPHGAVCAALLPGVMAANIRALQLRAASAPALSRFGIVATLVTRRAAAAPEESVAWLRELVSDLGVPSLGTYGIDESHLPAIVQQAERASSMKANPVALTTDEVAAIVAGAL